MVALASVLGGVLVGALFGVIGQWLNLLIIFPLAIGALAAIPAFLLVTRFKVRAPVLVMALTFSAGAIGSVMTHVVAWKFFQHRVLENVSDVDAVLEAEGFSPGFRGFLELQAQQGVSIKKAGSSGSGPTLTGMGAWIFWLVELLISAGVALAMGRDAVSKPFCEACDGWFSEPVVAFRGSGSKTAVSAFKQALEAGDPATAARELGAPVASQWSEVHLASCPQCASASVITVQRVEVAKNKNKTSKVLSALVPRVQVDQLLEARKATP